MAWFLPKLFFLVQYINNLISLSLTHCVRVQFIISPDHLTLTHKDKFTLQSDMYQVK